MAVWQEAVKEDPSVAATIEASDGETGLSGLRPVGQAQAGVDPSARRIVHAVDATGAGVNDLGSDSSSHHRLARPSRVAEHVGGADPAAPVFAHQAGRGVDPLAEEREFARDMAAEFPRAGGDLLGEMMRPAALLAMQVVALTLISEPAAPWPEQFGAMLIWMAGCIALFLSSWR